MAWTDADMTEFERLIKLANPHFERFTKSSLHNLIALLKRKPAPTKDAVQQEMDRLPDKKEARYRTPLNYLRRRYPGLDEVVRGGLRLQAFAGIVDEEKRMSRAILAMGRCFEVVSMCQKCVGKVVGRSVTAKSPANWTEAERKATELFQKWFDDSRNPASVNRVRTVFNSMAEALKGNSWDIVVYGTPEDPDPDHLGALIAGAYAYVIPSENAFRIYLGSSFWKEGDARIDTPTVAHAKVASTPEQWREEKKLKSAFDAAIVTTVHELCHVRAISGTTDITDVQPDPYDWAVCRRNAKTAPHLALTNAENYAMFGSALLMEKHFW